MSENSGKAGSYSVSVKSFFSSWKKKEGKQPIEIDKKKKKTLKTIIYPIFEKCSELTEDKFWQSIFMDCAYGKFPRGYNFKNNLLTYRKANKMNRLEVNDIPYEVFTSIIDFLQKTSGIMSVEDRKRLEKKNEENIYVNQNSVTWKDIKTEKMKDIMICEFITDVAEKMNMNEEEKNDLTTTIKKGFILKYFTSNNIIMFEGRISEIEGLFYNEKTKLYEIDSSYIYKRPGRKIHGLGIEKYDKKPEIDFLDTWAKYLENLENKRCKKISSYSSSNYSQANNDSLSGDM